jgi:hypothetical protein
VRRVGSECVVDVAHRLEVGRRWHALVVEGRAFAARRAVGVCRADDQFADPGREAERDGVGNQATEAEKSRRPFTGASMLGMTVRGARTHREAPLML